MMMCTNWSSVLSKVSSHVVNLAARFRIVKSFKNNDRFFNI